MIYAVVIGHRPARVPNSPFTPDPLALKVPVPEIAKKLTIKTGKNAGQHPSVASIYRALAEAGETGDQAETHVVGLRRPVRARITGAGSGTDPGLMERLPRQVLDTTADETADAVVGQTEDGTTDVVAELLAQARNGRNDA
ncbi:hypothetical protein [Streptomyces sp. NPDC056663]|uniref:hypothetical protein n=1 Tax=Streptomyces sp. NPDC056663 TaxID=3345899 RepID=UPI0036C921A9